MPVETSNETLILYAQWIDGVKPVISGKTIEKNDDTSYYVYAFVTDNVGVTRVQFPTWTVKNDQDDIIWGEGIAGDWTVEEQKYNYRYLVKISDHNNEGGPYVANIYAYDAAGNKTTSKLWEYTVIPTLTIDPNGGTYSGQSSIKQNYFTTTNLSVPTRDGYIFKDWQMANHADGAMLANTGKIYKNPYIWTEQNDTFFKIGNMLSLYNNANNGTVVHERVEKSSDTNLSDLYNSYNSHVLKITTNGNATPGLGGFYFKQTQSYANAEFYTIFQAKIPKGYTLAWWTNAAGDNRYCKWLTPEVGTDEWETYVCYVHCGAFGNFSDTNYFCINGPLASVFNPVSWYVATSCVYDATGLELNSNDFISNRSGATTYTFGAGNQTLVALWEPNTWDRYAEEPTMNADGYYYINTAEQLAWFAKQSKTQDVIAKIKLTADIDLSAHRWLPIGNATYAFHSNGPGDHSSEFDGQSYTISGMKNMSKNDNYQGFFGHVMSDDSVEASIHDLNLIGEITGLNHVGGLIGYGYAVVKNCNISVNVSGLTNVGGIIGYNISSGLTNICNYGSVSGLSAVGGISGSTFNYCAFNTCRNFGSVTGDASGVGGIFGEYHNASVYDMYISLDNCYNSGAIEGRDNVGGLAGLIFQEDLLYILSVRIIGCGVNANITSTSIYSKVGGLVGRLDVSESYLENSTIEGCYFNGSMDVETTAFTPETCFIGAELSEVLSITDSVYVKVDSTDGLGTIKSYINGTFENFSYLPGVNSGLPVPRGLFWIGGVGGQDILSFFKNKGFTQLIIERPSV